MRSIILGISVAIILIGLVAYYPVSGASTPPPSESCTGTSTAYSNCPKLTDESFCIPSGPFALVYSQVSGSPGKYLLISSTPSSFYYNVYYSYSGATPKGTTFKLTIPYPFVTTGANPIQVFERPPLSLPPCDSSQPSPSNVNSMFTISPTSIALSSYGSTPTIGSTTVTVTFTYTGSSSIPKNTPLWFSVELSYGLQSYDFTHASSKTSTACGSGYATVGSTGAPTFKTSNTIAYCQSYTFSGPFSTTTIDSVNDFFTCPSVSKTGGAKLVNADLQGCNLAGYNLKGDNLQNANLQNANLQNANLQGANLQNANLQNANGLGADFEGAKLQNANLQGVDLQGDNFQGADLQSASLENTNFQGANLQGAKLQTASLQGANLRGANLQGADLQGANMAGTALTGLSASQETNFNGAKMQNAFLGSPTNPAVCATPNYITASGAKLPPASGVPASCKPPL